MENVAQDSPICLVPSRTKHFRFKFEIIISAKLEIPKIFISSNYKLNLKKVKCIQRKYFKPCHHCRQFGHHKLSLQVSNEQLIPRIPKNHPLVADQKLIFYASMLSSISPNLHPHQQLFFPKHALLLTQ